MKKRKNKVLFFTVLFSIIACASAWAGTWQETDGKWWYDNGDGSYPANGWNWIDGDNDGTSECYYFDTDGWILIGTITPDGYQVDSKGAWVVNGEVQKQKSLDPYDNDTNRRALAAYKNELLNAYVSEMDRSELSVFDLNNDGVYEVLYYPGGYYQYFLYFNNGLKKEEMPCKFGFELLDGNRFMGRALEAGAYGGWIYELVKNNLEMVDRFAYYAPEYDMNGEGEQKEQQYEKQKMPVSLNTVRMYIDNINRYLSGNGECTGFSVSQTGSGWSNS